MEKKEKVQMKDEDEKYKIAKLKEDLDVMCIEMANAKIDMELLQEEMVIIREENITLVNNLERVKSKLRKLEQEKAKENEKEKKDKEKIERNGEKVKEEQTNAKSWIVIRKGKRYREGAEVQKMIGEMIGNAEWSWEKTRSDDVGIIKFRKEIDKKFLWKRRIEIFKKGEFIIDEYLDEEERWNRRHMIEIARKLGGEGKKVIVENRKMKVNEKWYMIKDRKLQETEDRTEEED